MRKLLPLTIACTLMVSCHDSDRNYPDLVIPSESVVDDDVHMSLYTHSESGETMVSVYMHRHHSAGYAQYLRVSGSDSLMAASADWMAEFTEELLPSDADPMLLYYSAILDDATPGRTVDVEFQRDQAALIPAQITILEQTSFSVSADADPIDLQSTLHVDWTAVAGYEYLLKFAFLCQRGEQTTGFTVKYPSQSSGDLVSPFDLDLAQFSPAPEGSSDCQVTVSLIASEDQSPVQSVDSETLNVETSQSQEQVLPLVVDA